MRPTVRTIAIALLAGAATTLSVAVACALAEANPMLLGRPSRWGERLTDNAGAEPVPEAYGAPLPFPTMHLEFSAADRRGVTLSIGRLRAYAGFTAASASPPRPPSPEAAARAWERSRALPWLDGHRPWPLSLADSVWLKSSGWPMRALVCRLQATNSPAFDKHTWTAPGGLILSSPTFPGWADWPPTLPAIVPATPLPVGFLVDTIAYAAFWLAGFATVRSIRDKIRLSPGRCPRCGYDLLGQPAPGCPECGFGRKQPEPPNRTAGTIADRPTPG